MSVGGAGTHGNAFSKGSTQDQAADAGIHLAQVFAGETTGLRQGLISAYNELLTTGGSRLPIFSQAVEQTRQASSKALSDTEKELAQSNLAGTPFGEAIKSGARQQGNIAAANTKTDILMQLFGQIQPFVLGQAGNATSGLSGAMGGNTKSKGNTGGASTSVAGGK